MEHPIYEIITSAEADGVKVDVVAYKVLKGSADPTTAETLFFAAQAGIAVLFSPVPVEEILKISLQNHKLSVDGNFALMRTKGIVFRSEKSSKSWVATSVSGEGLLQTFTGTGTVWIAPTQGVYERMTTPKGLHSLVQPPGSKGTFVGINNGKRG